MFLTTSIIQAFKIILNATRYQWAIKETKKNLWFA